MKVRLEGNPADKENIIRRRSRLPHNLHHNIRNTYILLYTKNMLSKIVYRVNSAVVCRVTRKCRKLPALLLSCFHTDLCVKLLCARLMG